jgi:hypothetical protein
MKKLLLLVAVLALSLTLSACKKETELSKIGLEGMTGKEILTGVGDGTIEVDGFGLSVYDDELIVILEDSRVSIDMPKDEFYLSVAPYTEITHECNFHSATGCRGELKDEEFFVELVDTDGNVILSETISTMSNGFFDLWLPRDIEGTLTITQGELVATKVISTATGEPTCETTMFLS